MSKLILITGLLASACVATDDPTETVTFQAIGADACPAGIPSTLAPAADQDLAFALDARGVQKYSCNAAGAWVFVAPEAECIAAIRRSSITTLARRGSGSTAAPSSAHA